MCHFIDQGLTSWRTVFSGSSHPWNVECPVVYPLPGVTNAIIQFTANFGIPYAVGLRMARASVLLCLARIKTKQLLIRQRRRRDWSGAESE